MNAAKLAQKFLGETAPLASPEAVARKLVQLLETTWDQGTLAGSKVGKNLTFAGLPFDVSTAHRETGATKDKK